MFATSAATIAATPKTGTKGCQDLDILRFMMLLPINVNQAARSTFCIVSWRLGEEISRQDTRKSRQSRRLRCFDHQLHRRTDLGQNLRVGLHLDELFFL